MESVRRQRLGQSWAIDTEVARCLDDPWSAERAKDNMCLRDILLGGNWPRLASLRVRHGISACCQHERVGGALTRQVLNARQRTLTTESALMWS